MDATTGNTVATDSGSGSAPNTGAGARRWAIGLGIAAVIWGVAFPVARPILGRLAEGGGVSTSFLRLLGGSRGMVAIEIALFVGTLATGIVALRRGQRGWTLLVPFVLALAIGGLWTIFAAGEVLFPH